MFCLDKKSVGAWNNIYGVSNDPVKQKIMFPLLVDKEDVHNKVVMDAGCGNGALTAWLLKHSPKHVVGLDKSRAFLGFARKNIASENVNFVCGSLLSKKNFEKNSFDAIYAVGVLDEIKNIAKALSNFHWALKKGGKFDFFVPHPSFALALYLFEKYSGSKNQKILGVQNYFKPFKATYNTSLARVPRPYFHHKTSEYLNALIFAGFKIEQVCEPQITKEIAEKYPAYREYIDIPRILIVKTCKE